MWEGAVAGKLVDEVVELAKKQGLVNRVINNFRKQHTVLIVGTTGVGKSNLLDSLTQFSPDPIDHMNRSETNKKHRILIDEIPFTVIDTPGQLAHRSRRLDAIRKALSEDVEIVVNVVSYGYHEYRRGLEGIFSEQGVASEAYLHDHREIEIAALSDWINILGGGQSAKHLITCVTKADLWWTPESYMEVINFYQSGKYFNALGDAQQLNPIVLPYSSVFHKFYNEGSMTGAFDDRDRNSKRNQLLKTLVDLVKEDG